MVRKGLHGHIGGEGAQYDKTVREGHSVVHEWGVCESHGRKKDLYMT
jgi:hypothetical protein